MKIFGEHYKKMAHYIYENSPEYFEDWEETLEACIDGKDWKQFLTSKEAVKIMSEMNPRAVWTIEDIKNACIELGVLFEKIPTWNLPALAVTMNMEYSDHEKSNAMLAMDLEKLTKLIYMRAVEKLEDADDKYGVRKYFGL
ncbi:MAG: hypothetical protein RSC29_07035 [Oscillospiraceae bacterium]